MSAKFHCIWIDDEPERIRRITNQLEFSRLLEITVVESAAEGASLFSSGANCDVAILDVDGGAEGNICRQAADSSLATLPWILISDLARDELAPGAASVAMSGHFLELARNSPEAAAGVLLNLCDDVTRGRPAVSRSLIVSMAHDAKACLDRVRWRLASVAGEISGLSPETMNYLSDIDSDIERAVHQLTAIQAQ